MARSIKRQTERETLKERRRSGEFKQDKKDARDSGLSRGEARKRAKRLSNVEALSKRKGMRSDMAAKREEDASASKMFADRRRTEAKRGGQKLAYDVTPASSPAEQRLNAPGGVPTKRMKSGDKSSFDKDKGMFKIVGADGYTRYSKVDPSKPRAQEGAKVKKKSTKSIGVLKSDANKVGPKKEAGKEPYTKNGVNYTWDRKNSVWRGDLDKKKSRAVKKAKDGAKISKSERLQQKDKNLKSKATTAYEEGKDKKGDRIQNRRLRVQKRENKAFIKDFKTAKNGGKVGDPPVKMTKKEKLAQIKGNPEQAIYNMNPSNKNYDKAPNINAKSDNTKSNKVTVKGEEEAYKVYENDYNRKQAVKEFNEQKDKSKPKVMRTVKALKKKN